MKVLFCGLKYEYGRPNLGLSYEYQNFFDVLKRMPGVEAEIFPMDEVMASVGRDAMNKQLIEKVEQMHPDLLFCVLFTEEIKKETINYITQKTSTKTFNWFTDDHWRLPVYSRYWAPLFTSVGTTDSQAMAAYQALGINNVIKTQWGANTGLYRPAGKPADQLTGKYDVSFVGKNYGNRGQYISALTSAGLPAQGFGKGWDGGVVAFETMLEIFSSSKINLNFTESYFSWPRQLAKLIVKKQMGRYNFNFHPLDQMKAMRGTRRNQIKGRTFEVPACSGFLLSGDADNLRDYYVDGKEIIIFKNKNDLVEKCRYYLAHEAERSAIAKAGYERTIKDHTYEQRFRDIFAAMHFGI